MRFLAIAANRGAEGVEKENKKESLPKKGDSL